MVSGLFTVHASPTRIKKVNLTPFAIELGPESASAHYNLGAALARSGQFAEAESHLRKALETNPNTQTYSGLGFVLWQQDRDDEAIASLRTAIEMDPKNAAACDALGTILVEQKRLEEAASVYRQLIRNQPSPAAHQKLAQILTDLGRTDEARRQLEMAQ